jgi:hypothetical protein
LENKTEEEQGRFKADRSDDTQGTSTLALDMIYKIVRAWQYGRTCLIEASWNGHEAVVRLLIEHKAEVNTADTVPRTQSPPPPFRVDVSFPLPLLTPKPASANTDPR